MKTDGIDHVAILVKDLDKAIQAFSKVFGINFKEIKGMEPMGIRICLSVPDPQIEFISVVDPIKAARKLVDFSEKVGEGVLSVFLRVNDIEEAAAHAEMNGAHVAFKVEEKQLGGFIPHFKEVTFDDEKGISLYGFGLIEHVDEKK